MKHLILVRHGQSIWNLKKRFTGWVDIELSEQGKSEAIKAGKLIKKLNLEFGGLFCSYQKRAIETLNLILNTLRIKNNDVIKAWELNERHYGGLTGLNKDETIKKYGFSQVQEWRRSFNTKPPQMEKTHPYKNKIQSNILSESLKDTFERVIPYYNKEIKPLINLKKNILIVFTATAAELC